MSNDTLFTNSATSIVVDEHNSGQTGASQFEAEAQKMVGQRLDFALSLLLPHMGLRGRKRCIENGLVLVNGRACTAAQRLRKGDVVSLQAAEQEPAAAAPMAKGVEQSAACAPGMDCSQCEPRLLAIQGALCFFYKPAGLHTAALVGGTAPSLEGMLPQLLVGDDGSAAGSCPQLLQRLDHGTSGIVCGAFGNEAAEDFRRLEVAGHCEKRYVALLAGRLEEDFTVRRALRTDKRNKSRVLECDTGRSRWTEFLPLYYFDGPELNLPAFDADSQFHRVGLTLAGCRIRRGARHQIRAHAASFGHPLWNDPLYGFDSTDDDSGAESASVFFLHHGCLTLPGATCIVPPPWTFLPEPAARRALDWLNSGY